MQKNIAVILGDGIGPEVTQEAIKVLDGIGRQFKHTFNYVYEVIGNEAIGITGNPLPEQALKTCLKSDAILMGAFGNPTSNLAAEVRPGQALIELRKALRLYTNILPITTYSSLNHLSPLKSNRLEGVDFIICTELTSGINYGDKLLSEEKTTASNDCTYHRDEIERITHLAFSYARKRRKVLTLVDKADLLETSRLWRKVVQELAVQYEDVTVDYMFAGDAAMQIITNPKQFDVILTESMFGDIISDEASVISGSQGLLPAAYVGNKLALFAPVQGKHMQAAGKNTANPIGSILSAAMMLEHFELKEEAELVREAVQWTLANGFVTKDLDPINNYTTSTIGDLVTDYAENRIPSRINKENMVISKSTII